MFAKEIIDRFIGLGNEKEAAHLARFFKTGPGDYGEGDRFLGIRVPETRMMVKESLKKYDDIPDITDIRKLTENEFHEIRLAGFLLLIEAYKKGVEKSSIVKTYLELIERGNNWDLVDLVAPKILGDYLVTRPSERNILYRLADMDGHLWHQRVAMVACLPLIRKGDYSDTLALAEHFLSHPHPLMHKASGWMLREVGKHGGKDQLLAFLDNHANIMPRTMLRYSLERLEPELRSHYMKL